jgi:FtsZ-interacting cell division protein ZipA
MSDLQLALIGLGILFLVAVFAFNKMQERKLRSRMERAMPTEEIADALLETPAVERKRAAEAAAMPPDDLPAEGAPSAKTAADAVAAPPVDEPAPGAGGRAVEHTLGLPPIDQSDAVGGALVLDPRVDFIATIVFAESRSGEEVLRRGGETLQAAKAIAWEGLRVDAGWEQLVAGGSYTEVRCGMQMVDRRGLATEADVLAFSQSVQALAATLGGESTFPSRRDALRLASALDMILAEADIQVALNVVHDEPIAAAKVGAAAESVGCALGRDGAFRLLTPEGAEVFAVTNGEPAPFSAARLGALSTRMVCVTLDVPRAPETGEAFNQFANFANRLAQAVGGRVVDDNQRPIAPQAMVAIAQHVAGARARMHEAGVPAGSPLALRIFA